MRIVSRNEFLSCPHGTMFSKYRDVVFDSLCIKGDSTGNDFWYVSLAESVDCEDIVEVMIDRKSGQVFRFDFECYSRDGLFDSDQLFAVWDSEDVLNLINILKKLPIKIER